MIPKLWMVLWLLASSQLMLLATPKREMRAVWIATVANIDWPSAKNLDVERQKAEMLQILDQANAYRLNTVVFQIRPACDALYQSSLEPWSVYLTGQSGLAPNPKYDPLEFVIAESRKRGLDVHVWLNPYRAEVDTAQKTVGENLYYRSNPNHFVTYGKTRYLNPGLPAVRDYVSRVVADIVRRYNIDAIHMDDYFYPYRIKGQEFPDQEAFEMFPAGYSASEKDNWRRNNVDLIIRQISDTIKSIKPEVAFGISPFGVWRNASVDPMGSQTKAGVTNYDDLYADILKWQKEGWIDYVTPQIYWEIGKEVADYQILVKWWNDHAYGCPVYIGQAWYRINPKAKEKAWHSSKEIIRQVELLRQQPNVAGSMYFSAKTMAQNPKRLKQRLLKKSYPHLALVPENPRIESITIQAPQNGTITRSGKQALLAWQPVESAKNYVIYRFRKGEMTNFSDASAIIRVTSDTKIVLDAPCFNKNKYYYAVSALSKTNYESAATTLQY